MTKVVDLASLPEYDHFNPNQHEAIGLNEQNMSIMFKRIVDIIIQEKVPSRIVQKLEEQSIYAPLVQRAFIYYMVVGLFYSGAALTTKEKRSLHLANKTILEMDEYLKKKIEEQNKVAEIPDGET